MVMIFGPNVEVGPLGALALWAVVIAGLVGLLGAVTLGGAVVFVLFALVAVLVAYFIMQRILGRAAGTRP